VRQNQALKAPDLDAPANGIERGIAALAHFPYQQRPFCARNWGHPLHSLCSYPSKLKPGVAHFLVRLFTEPADRVLDPFAGVGTVPFEACVQGRHGIGGDLSPFASLVTAAKVAPPAPTTVEDVLDEFSAKIPTIAAWVNLDAVEPEIRTFFHDDTCREVVAARELLIGTELGATTGGRLLGAAICHILHGNRPYALSRRSHGIIPIPPRGDFVYRPLVRSLTEKIERSGLDRLANSFTVGEGYVMDAFSLDVDDSSIDAIITSPPFLGTTEFLRQNRVRLWFCGMSYARQRADKDRFVEHRRDLDWYGDLLSEWSRVLKPGGRLIMHLGVVRKRDMAKEIRVHAEEAALEVHAVLYEPTDHLESHGRTDRGATHIHQFLIATRR